MTSAAARRLAYIDGLRLIGAGAVVIQHLFERITAPSARLLVAPAPGVFGVVLFFLISGFVIPFSVRGGLDVRAFTMRRVTRIYPVYLVVIGLALLAGLADVAPYFHRVVDADLGEWVANLLLLQDFVGAKSFYSVTWTLTIEFIWYGLFVCLVKGTGSRAGPVSALAAPAVMIALTFASLAIDTRIPLGRPGMVYAAVLGYQTYRHHIGEISTPVWRANIAGFLLVTLASNFIAFGYFHHPNISLMQAIGPWIAALAAFAVSVRVSAVQGALANPIVAGLGAASYSIYMMHPLAIALAVRLGAPAVVIPAALLLTLVMAMLSYRFVEQPGIRLGRYLADRKARIRRPLSAF